MSNNLALSDVKRYTPDMPSEPSQKAEILSSTAPTPTNLAQDDERTRNASPSGNTISVPDSVAASGSLEKLVETARGYAEQAVDCH